jgi:two-component system sensor histidine kinase BarA
VRTHQNHPLALVVEDDPITRQLLENLLQEQGCDVDSVEDGEKAIAYLDANTYRVILLDIVLPKKSGTDVMEHLRQTQPRLLQRVIVVSGLNVEEIRKLFPSVSQALSKPVMPSRLLHAVNLCLGRGHEQLTVV